MAVAICLEKHLSIQMAEVIHLKTKAAI